MLILQTNASKEWVITWISAQEVLQHGITVFHATLFQDVLSVFFTDFLIENTMLLKY